MSQDEMMMGPFEGRCAEHGRRHLEQNEGPDGGPIIVCTKCIQENRGIGGSIIIGRGTLLHCWEDDPERGRTCILPDGHEGEHEWVHDGEVVISFSNE